MEMLRESGDIATFVLVSWGRLDMQTNMEKTESSGKDEKEFERDATVDSSKSHAFVSRIKHEDIRCTQSSPHRNVELHHTRSFSEICHLHPSHTDISSVTAVCPKPRALMELQHEVRRPESVLEMSDLPSESDDECEEDFLETQEKGDEAMKIFLESNISVPLDGAMTSSSISRETLDSDVASEHELVVGNWEQEARDSIASTNSSIEKRFLTPSGLLLYREHQVDSMLDTKRLKLTPSSSERPMSPLAMQGSDENVKCKTSSGSSRNGRRYKMVSDSDSEEQEDDLNKEHSYNRCGGEKTQDKDCDCSVRLENLTKIVHKYEMQCEELISKNKEQYNEIKALRKDNVNMHREHNRLQVVIRECHQIEDTLKANIAAISNERDQKIAHIRQSFKELETNLQDKTTEVEHLQNNIDIQVQQEAKYLNIIKEIQNESRALLEVIARELGLERFELQSDANAEAILSLLKTRRNSLPEDLRNFFKTRNQADKRNRMKQDLTNVRVGSKDRPKSRKAEKSMGKSLKRSASMETVLKEARRNYDTSETPSLEKSEVEVELVELRRKSESLARENKELKDDCSKWKTRFEQIVRNTDRRRKELPKPTPSEELLKLQTYLKQRRKSYSLTQLETLQGNPNQVGALNVEPTTRGRNLENPEGLGGLEDRLQRLSKLTEDLSKKIEKSNENLGKNRASFEIENDDGGMKDYHDRVLSALYGESLFSVIKGVYNDHLGSLMDNVHSREQECRNLREELVVKSRNEEVTRCYIESLKRALAVCQENLRNCKNKNQDLKQELRGLKDWVLITNAEQDVSLSYCKNGVVAQDNREDVDGIIEDAICMKKQLKHSGM